MDIYSEEKAPLMVHGDHSRPLRNFLFSSLALVEVKASIMMLSFAALSFYLQPGFYDWNIKIIDSFYKAQAQQTVNEIFEAPIIAAGNEKNEDQYLKFNNDLKSFSDFYSFEYTSLGFYTKSLQFIEGLSRSQAEEKMTELLPKALRSKAKNYIRATLIICEKYQVDPLWVLSVMWTESHFRPMVRSHVGASGLMQVMPGTRKYLYRTMKRRGDSLLVEKTDFDINSYFNFEIKPKQFKKYVKKLVNIELGVVYLKKLLKNFNYNHKYATVAYNMGPGWTQKRLRNDLPVGNDNLYLTKVMRAYRYLVRRI